MRLGVRCVLATIALAVLASGCPVGPNFVKPEVDAPAEFRGQVLPAEAASLADQEWWEVFQDPVLQRLVDEAIASNYDLRRAAARVEQFHALVGVERADLFPLLSYGGGATRGRGTTLFGVQGADGTANLFAGVFSLAWEIDVWGRIRRSTEAAQANLLAAEEFRRGVLLTLVSGVAQAYLELLELDRELEIARETTDTFRQTLELFTRRYQGGVGSKLQTSRAAAALAQAEATIPKLEQQIVAKENQISVLLGRNPSPIPRGAPLVQQSMPPATPPGLPSELLERRPDIAQAEDLMRSANAQVGVAVASFFPKLGLSGVYGGASTELENVVKGNANIWNIAAQLTGPLFQGGALLEQYWAQKALWEQTKLEYEQIVLTAFSEVSNVLVAQQKLGEIRAAQEREVAALQESVRLSLLRYNTGLANYYEVLEAEQQLFPAELSLAQTQGDQLTIVVQLYRALGGGWNLPVDEWTLDEKPPPGG